MYCDLDGFSLFIMKLMGESGCHFFIPYAIIFPSYYLNSSIIIDKISEKVTEFGITFRNGMPKNPRWLWFVKLSSDENSLRQNTQIY